MPAELTERFVVIGDLHLDPDPRIVADASDVAFLNLVRELIAEAEGAPRRHLVLLGDVIDFDRVRHTDPTAGLPAASAAVDLLAATHAPLVEALRAAAGAGFRLHVVAGNHDPEWARPDVEQRLRRLIGGDATIEIHPWMLRVPERLHAEHGNHFHDLNAMPRPSQPFAPDAPGLHLGSVIDRWAAEVRRAQANVQPPTPRGLVRCTTRLLGAHLRLAWRGLWRVIVLTAPAERRRRAHYRAGELGRYARDMGLGADVAAAIDRLGQIEPLAMTRRLVAAARHRGPDTRGQVLMRGAARALDKLFQRFGSPVSVILLAHSHVAEISALPDGRWYANPGRWAPDLDGAFPYVEVTWHDGSVTVELLAWDDAVGGSRRVTVGRVVPTSQPDLS